jgi:pimeloyl-ACP methyl ester carboxylesterase
MTVLPGAAHIPTVQTPDAVTDALRAFLAAQPP